MKCSTFPFKKARLDCKRLKGVGYRRVVGHNHI